MDAIVGKLAVEEPDISPVDAGKRPTEAEALEAVRTIIKWAGDNPDRQGLEETPQRFLKAYDEFFRGYRLDVADVLDRTFEETGGYDDIVLLREIDFNSHCEHHMVPFIGKAHIAYLPTDRIVGLSKLARVVEIFAARLQTQEHLSAQIAHAIDYHLQPRGVAVMLEAVHHCMTLRGVKKAGAATITTQFKGAFKADPALQAKFISLVRHGA